MAQPPNYRQVAAADAKKYGVPVDVFLRQIQQESGFSPTAHSGAGADGIAQFIPSTAKSYGVNTRDPLSSLDGAARMDADLIKRYGSVARALSAYNSGRPDAYKDPGFASGQTYNYVRSILGGTKTGGAGAMTPSALAPAAAGTPTPGRAPNRQALVQALLAASDSGDYGKFFGAVKQRRATMQAPPVQTLPGQLGQPVDAQPLPYKPGTGGGYAELLHEGVGGPTNSTGEHIHFAATDPQKELAGIKLAQSLGLQVRENPYTGDTVDPVHAKSSYHYRTFPGKYNGRTLGEAADASGDRQTMLKFYRMLGGK